MRWRIVLVHVLMLSMLFEVIRAVDAAPPTEEQETFLDTLAQKTWAYISSDWATDNHLPWSWRSATISGGDYVNTTEIGMYMLSYIAANELGETEMPSVESEIGAVLDQLLAWQTGSQSDQQNGANAYKNSVFYQWYWVNPDPSHNRPPIVGASDNDHVVPSIDNALLAACLMTIRGWADEKALLELHDKADAILKSMDFTLFYNNARHRFRLGAPESPAGGVDADYYSNENRIINFVARALGQLTPEEFQASIDALEQPEGTYTASTGAFTVKRVAWDGSLFTYLVPGLFFHEIGTYYDTNTIEPAVGAQIAFAHDQQYTAWGFSDTFDIEDRGYIQSGALPTSMTTSPKAVEDHPGVVTPHASALALMTSYADEAAANLQTLSTFDSLYDPMYGFKDSVMVKTDDPNYGVASERFSELAQTYILLSIAQHKTGFIWKYFYADSDVAATDQELFGQGG